MEKFYIVTEKSELNKDYFDWKENLKTVNNHVKKFSKENGIESKEYYATDEMFYIVPTENDSKTFNNSFLKQEFDDGLKAFKKNSIIRKAWVKSLKEKNIKILHKSYADVYFEHCYGKFTTRLFDVDSVVYLSINNEYELETPEGMTEIKASEFYKIVEDHNEKVRNKKETEE